MKMAAVKKVIMEARRCIIVNDAEGKQWIGDGKRFYAVDEDIRFDRETVLTILDIDKDKRSKVTVFEETSSDPRFSIYLKEDEGERLKPRMAVMYGGELVMVFMTERQEVFAIEHAALKPIDEMGRDYTLLRREAYGAEMVPVIAVQTDMFVSALLQPIRAGIAGAIAAECQTVGGGKITNYQGDDEEIVKETE